MKKLLSLAAACFFASVSYAQGEVSSTLPSESIKAAAAHLPELSKYDGNGEQVVRGTVSYEAESITALESWVKTYPQEVNNYMNVVSVYMHDVQESDLPASDKEAYADLKAQWVLIHDISTSEK